MPVYSHFLSGKSILIFNNNNDMQLIELHEKAINILTDIELNKSLKQKNIDTANSYGGRYIPSLRDRFIKLAEDRQSDIDRLTEKYKEVLNQINNYGK